MLMAQKNRLVLLMLFLFLICITQCEARGLRQSKKKYSLFNALFILKFVKTVEPNVTGDAVSLADDSGGGGPSVSNPPFCVNPPDEPSPPSTSTTPSTTPFIPSQPPPLPPFGSSPPAITPGPPTVTPGLPNVAPGPPKTVPSPIIIVPSPPSFEPSPPEFVPGGPGGFLPPIVYPPPLAPPLPPGAGQPLWCVAKPTVPDPIIQEAMDYACASGAECKSIQPSGACYQPDTVLAHASYAFNSYWQRTKAFGGTCDFGGTATIVTRDPSYEKCQFNLL